MASANAANPGQGSKVTVGFANGQRSWEERVDLVRLLGEVLIRERRQAQVKVDELETTLGLLLRPQVVSVQPQHPKGAKTVTTIEFAHPALGGATLFEYQHALGDDINAAFAEGFAQWARFDLPTVLCALEAEPKDCNVMRMTFPPKEPRVEKLSRRVLLGPIAHVAELPGAADDDHPFCPCCLLTNSFDAFWPLLEANAVYGLRLFAARDEQGVAQADCRVNGEDFDAGRAALVAYAEKWPARGFEFRKQYVIVQTVDV
jgi:hypothetical protein